MATIPRERPLFDIAPIWIGVAVAAWALTGVLLVSDGFHAISHGAVLEERGQSWFATIALFLLAWQVMTAAMMLPSSLPMIRLFGHVSARQERPHLALGVFLAAYFAVWTGFAVVALAGDAVLHSIAGQWSWLNNRPWLIPGSVLILAGAFQFSSLKERCLDACRSPVGFLFRFYQRGTKAAWNLGIRHGLFCLGCCWALMLLMFAVGVGSLVGMAALTGVMVIEKTHSQGRRLASIVGIVLLVWGGLVLVQPDWLPAPLLGVEQTPAHEHSDDHDHVHLH